MSKNDDSTVILIVIGILVVLGLGIGAYFVLKGWADAMGLDVYSIFCLVAGVGTVALIAIGTVWMGWKKTFAFPWFLPILAVFARPAFTYWTTPQMGPFGRDSEEVDMAWYGNGWWQLLIIVGLCGVAFALMKWLDDDYR